MYDNENEIKQLKHLYCSGEFMDSWDPVRLVRLSFEDDANLTQRDKRHVSLWKKAFFKQFERHTDSTERDTMLAVLWRRVFSDLWVWDAFVALCHWALEKPDEARHPLLVEFALLAVTGKRKRPGSGPGHPVIPQKEQFAAFCAVAILTDAYGYTKTKACKTVAEWHVLTPGMTPRTPDAIRKMIQRFKNN